MVQILSTERKALRTALPPVECARRLQQRTTRFMEGAPLATKPFTGSISEHRFRIRVRHPYGDDFAPVANGVFERDHLGTRLDLRLTMSMKGRIWVALWLAFIVIFGTIQVIRELTSAPSLGTALQRAAESMMGPMMLGALLGVGIAFGAWLARADRQLLISGIRDLIEASAADEERPLE